MDRNRMKKLIAAENRFVGGNAGVYLLSASSFAVALLALLFYVFFMLSGAYDPESAGFYAYLSVGVFAALIAGAGVFFAVRAKRGGQSYAQTTLYAAFCFLICAVCGYLLIRDAWLWNCDAEDVDRFGGFMSSAMWLSFIAFAAVAGIYAGACFIKADSPATGLGRLYPISCILPLTVICCVLVCIRAEEQPEATYSARRVVLIYCSVMLAFSARYLFKSALGLYLSRSERDADEYERMAAEIESVTDSILKERSETRALTVESFPDKFETIEIEPEAVSDDSERRDSGKGADLGVIFNNVSDSDGAQGKKKAGKTERKGTRGSGSKQERTAAEAGDADGADKTEGGVRTEADSAQPVKETAEHTRSDSETSAADMRSGEEKRPEVKDSKESVGGSASSDAADGTSANGDQKQGKRAKKKPAGAKKPARGRKAAEKAADGGKAEPEGSNGADKQSAAAEKPESEKPVQGKKKSAGTGKKSRVSADVSEVGEEKPEASKKDAKVEEADSAGTKGSEDAVREDKSPEKADNSGNANEAKAEEAPGDGAEAVEAATEDAEAAPVPEDGADGEADAEKRESADGEPADPGKKLSRKKKKRAAKRNKN